MRKRKRPRKLAPGGKKSKQQKNTPGVVKIVQKARVTKHAEVKPFKQKSEYSGGEKKCGG